jgi:tetratricopeptide (TPR) repeat protein
MAEKQSSPMQKILKWVAAISALLSLAFAIQQIVEGITESNSNERQISELKQLAQVQQESGDYAMAWDSLDSAAKLADSGGAVAKFFGRLDAVSKQLRIAREDLAMAWLDDIHIVGGGKFSDVVNKLLPVLEQGSIAATSGRKADLIAHIGWAQFLRSRDGEATDPQRSYEQALKIDANNPYAHAYLGHWMIWKGESLEAADAHFTAALQANRAKEKVRTLQLAAYANRQSDGDVLYVVTVAQMLAAGEKVSVDSQSRARWHLARACGTGANGELLADLRKRIPPKELAALYATLRANAPDSYSEEAARKVSSCLAG